MNDKRSKTSGAREAFITRISNARLLLKINRGIIVYDDFDSVGDYYEQQKVQAQKYFDLRKLDKLEKQLHRSLQSTKGRDAQEVAKYIKEHAGYDIDIFAAEKKHIDEVINKGRIDTEEERFAISFMLGKNKIPREKKDKIKTLNILLTSFYQKQFEAEKLSPKRRRGYTEITKIEEKDGIITERYESSTGPKPYYVNERKAVAPDKKHKLIISEVGFAKHSSTTVSIVFKDVTLCPFGISGIHPDLNAYWKDNNTVVIEWNGSFPAFSQIKKLRSFDQTINIEYVEK
ncbi:MAG: hypothetical protein EOO07_06035 [Chitinophagaceae bacterium]|nr:MAG: hypothetical protein EOO07_06035 [Chitinophagaceae bacterium]